MSGFFNFAAVTRQIDSSMLKSRVSPMAHFLQVFFFSEAVKRMVSNAIPFTVYGDLKAEYTVKINKCVSKLFSESSFNKMFALNRAKHGRLISDS